MRTIGGPALALITGAQFTIHQRLEVKNASGTWKDLGALAGKDYVVGVRLSTDVDSPVWSLQATLKRDGEAATESLSPLRGDSTLNVDDLLAPAPLVQAARQWRVSVACVAVGATPSGLDWVELCAGYLDKPDFTSDPMSVEGRSVGARLMDQTIRTKRTYSGSLSSVAQQIVTDNVPSPAPTLYVPVAPSFTVTDYTPYGVSVMDALVTLALSTGWMIRDVYDPGDGTMKTAILDPGRAQATADTTIAPSVYLTVDGASLDVANVRNVIEGEYVDGVTGEVLTQTVSDPASIAAFGGVERYMKFSEDATSPIDTGNEMVDMLESALADLSTPKFDHVVTSTLFWPSEIADLYDFTGNAVHYDTTQRLAVFGIVHDLTTPGHATTQWQCRGTPSGAYLEWIRRQGDGPQIPQPPPAPDLMFALGELTQFGGTLDTVDGGIWLGYRMPAGVDEIRVHVLLGMTEDVGIPNIDNTTLALTIRRPEGDLGTPAIGIENQFPNAPGEYASLALLSTRPSLYKRLLFYGVRGGLTSVPVITPPRQAVDPTPVRIDGTIADMDVVRSGGTNTVTVTPGTLESTDSTRDGNWLCLIRNGHILPPVYIKTSTDPVVFVDSGLPEDASYEAVYDAFIWNGGQSGAKFRAVADAPTVTAPVWALGTPSPVIDAGVAKIQLSWTATTPGATGVRAEASLDGLTVRTVGTGSLASGTVYDLDTSTKLYRLVATNGGTDVIATPWKWSTRLPPAISNPAAVPQIVAGYPKVVMRGYIFAPTFHLAIAWTCATAGARQVRIQESTDNGVGDAWATVPNSTSASVASGVWYSPDSTAIGVDMWYRVQALDIAGAVLASSPSVHYIPPA